MLNPVTRNNARQNDFSKDSWEETKGRRWEAAEVHWSHLFQVESSSSVETWKGIEV